MNRIRTKRLKKLVERSVNKIINEENEFATNYGQPVRSPFSHYTDYNRGRNYTDEFQDLTQLYNTSYRSKFQEDAFEAVYYSEPLNTLVAYPLEESEFESPYVIFGLKTARGFLKDYRNIDEGMNGAGSYYVTEEEANRLIQDPKKTISELNRGYFGHIGFRPAPRENLRESVLNEKAASETQQRLFGMVYAYKNDELDLDDLDDDLAKKVKDIADGISMKDAKEFASTEHEGIPPKVESVKEAIIRKRLRKKIVTEECPPGWYEKIQEMKTDYPDEFGGENPNINPYAFAWSVYNKNKK